jgi:hypothetical protein
MPTLQVEEIHAATSSHNPPDLTQEVAEYRSDSDHAETKKKFQLKDSSKQKNSKLEENGQDSKRKHLDSESK